MGKQPIDCSGPSLTQQSAKDECDINIIVARAKAGADLSQLSRGPGMYGDFRNLPDLRESLLIVNAANEAFMALDAHVRKRFANDPAVLLDFLKDPANRDEAIKLGLVKAPEVPVVDEHLETLKSIDKGLRDRSSDDLDSEPGPAKKGHKGSK